MMRLATALADWWLVTVALVAIVLVYVSLRDRLVYRRAPAERSSPPIPRAVLASWFANFQQIGPEHFVCDGSVYRVVDAANAVAVDGATVERDGLALPYESLDALLAASRRREEYSA